MISIPQFYNQVTVKKELALKEIKNDNRKIALIWLLLFATVGWIISFFSYCFEMIRGDYNQFTTVHDCAVCNDGWISHSWGPGTCSWHGGVSYYKFKDVLTGVHLANPDTSIVIILICLLILILPSIFNRIFRITAFSFQLTGIYLVFILSRSFYRVVTFPIYMIYHLLKTIVIKNDV